MRNSIEEREQEKEKEKEQEPERETTYFHQNHHLHHFGEYLQQAEIQQYYMYLMYE